MMDCMSRQIYVDNEWSIDISTLIYYVDQRLQYRAGNLITYFYSMKETNYT